MSVLLPYIIKGGVHAYFFLSKLFSDVDIRDFANLIFSRSLQVNISLFVTSYYNFAQREPDLRSRFVVTLVGINKGPLPGHEYLAIWVKDALSEKHHEFVIKRGVMLAGRCEPCLDTDHDGKFSTFSRFPDSQTVLESIQKALRNKSTVIMTQTETKTNSEKIPPTNTPPTPLSAIDLDIVATTIARTFEAARTSSKSISPQRSNFVSVILYGHAPGTLKPQDCIRRLEPMKLSLFDVALLALVVHNLAPIYGFFENQSYTYASIIFEAIIQLYSYHPNVQMHITWNPTTHHLLQVIPAPPPYLPQYLEPVPRAMEIKSLYLHLLAVVPIF